MSSEKKRFIPVSPGRPPGAKNLSTKPHKRFDAEAKKKFLKVYERCGILTEAATAAGVSRHTVYKALNSDEVFKERFEITKDRCLAKLEKEFDDRIYSGNEKIEYDGEGQITKRTVTKDNNLLVKALEVHAPEKYGKKADTSTQNVQINIGDSAIDKLASFLKVDIHEERAKAPPEDGDNMIEAEWEETNGED